MHCRILLALLLGLLSPGLEAKKCSVNENEQSSVTYLLRQMVNSYNPNDIPNPSILLALRLARDHSLTTEKEMIKQLKEDAVSRVQNNVTFSSGTVALYVLALQASCDDPQNVSALNSSVNLVQLLQKKYNDELENIQHHSSPITNYYQLGLDVLALCLQNVSVNISALLVPTCEARQYTYGSQFSVDTASVAVLGLTCVKARKDLSEAEKKKVRCSVCCLVKKILNKGASCGVIGNIYSTGLAMQALSVSDECYSRPLWNCNKTLQKVLREIPLSTFDNPMAASQITPSLEGKTYLDVRGKTCAADQDNLTISTTVPPTTSPPANITVTYTVVDGVNNTFNNSIIITVPLGSTFLTVMQKAQASNNNTFSFTVTPSSWGPYVTSVHGLAASDSERTYWQLLSGSNPLMQGVGDYKPLDGENLVVKLSTY
ncbi:transcobalamin-1-like [Rhinatrema bivittatum]|uniref:transcobalamin-1-like n=1 Tax=Rhinatrema bivittatum TaxID=194408 RepID=UPI001129AE46|nr:transcobalamin-1-like [Rhinatrema bivittatum]